MDESDLATLEDIERTRVLSLAVFYAYGAAVDGDIVEFGTMRGVTAQAIALAMVSAERRYGQPPRSLLLFDSFEGLPEALSEVDRKSPHVLSGAWAPGGCKLLDRPRLESLIGGIVGPDRVSVHAGWFSDTVPLLSPETRLSMIHFDGDLYQSTIDALDPCFERGLVSRGAVVCFDDWNCNRADPNLGERRAWRELAEKHRIVFTSEGWYSMGGHRLIVHDYGP